MAGDGSGSQLDDPLAAGDRLRYGPQRLCASAPPSRRRAIGLGALSAVGFRSGARRRCQPLRDLVCDEHAVGAGGCVARWLRMGGAGRKETRAGRPASASRPLAVRRLLDRPLGLEGVPLRGAARNSTLPITS